MIGAAEPLPQNIQLKEEKETLKILGIRMVQGSERINELTWEETLGGMEKRLKF